MIRLLEGRLFTDAEIEELRSMAPVDTVDWASPRRPVRELAPADIQNLEFQVQAEARARTMRDHLADLSEDRFVTQYFAQFHVDQPKEVEQMNDVLTRLRTLQCDRAEIDELVFLRAQADALQQAYITSALTVPEWLSDAQNELRKEIADRRVDALTRERKLLRASKRSLMSREDKVAELDKREREIDELLGLGQPASAPTTAP